MGALKEIFGESLPIQGGGHVDVSVDQFDPAEREAVLAEAKVAPKQIDPEKLKKLAEKNPELAGALGAPGGDKEKPEAQED